jgi:glycosyltransferase involved in cell wall biosynthesis
MVRAYPGRVIEGMASGRPVISWEIPNRPKNRALFKEGEEIFIFSEPYQLAAQIRKIIEDPEFAEKISSNARLNLLRYHTIEKRVGQILAWIETGVEPPYS